jgi:hypothetical protein
MTSFYIIEIWVKQHHYRFSSCFNGSINYVLFDCEQPSPLLWYFWSKFKTQCSKRQIYHVIYSPNLSLFFRVYDLNLRHNVVSGRYAWCVVFGNLFSNFRFCFAWFRVVPSVILWHGLWRVVNFKYGKLTVCSLSFKI